MGGKWRCVSGLSNKGVYAFREAKKNVVPRQDLLAFVNYFLLQTVSSGGH